MQSQKYTFLQGMPYREEQVVKLLAKIIINGCFKEIKS